MWGDRHKRALPRKVHQLPFQKPALDERLRWWKRPPCLLNCAGICLFRVIVILSNEICPGVWFCVIKYELYPILIYVCTRPALFHFLLLSCSYATQSRFHFHSPTSMGQSSYAVLRRGPGPCVGAGRPLLPRPSHNRGVLSTCVDSLLKTGLTACFWNHQILLQRQCLVTTVFLKSKYFLKSNLLNQPMKKFTTCTNVFVISFPKSKSFLKSSILISDKTHACAQSKCLNVGCHKDDDSALTAYPRRHETPFLKRNAEFPFAESRFSQPLYQ